MTQRKTFVVLLLLMTVIPCLRAQKKELGQARSYIKSGKDYDKAEQLMTDLLKDSAHQDNKRIYQTWYEAVSAQYEAANEKLYLKQKYDTAQFFNLIRRMYLITERLDSLDARPDKKGRVRPEYRHDHATQMDLLRRNLYYGGTYQIRKSHYDDAYGFFDVYLDAARQPLFTGYEYARRDTLMPQAAYWATFCGYKLHRPDSILRYSELALQDSSKRDFTMLYVCEAYRMKHDDAAYKAALLQGFTCFPEHSYFFPRLADYYTAREQNDSVRLLSMRGLDINSDNQLFLLAQSNALLNLERYEECMAVSERLIALNDSMPEPYYNVATTYLNRALELERKNQPRIYRRQLQQLYAAARPYMEDYRRLAPDDSRRWAPALYRIYLNLNMGRQFEEIDRVMKRKKLK